MKLKNLPIKIIGLIFLLCAFLFTGFWYFKLRPQVKTIDNFPIMLINNGKTAVYRELKVSKGSIENQIVVSSLSDEDQKETKIYEYIPKEIAQKASDLQFSLQPEIIEDDPIILWSVDRVKKKPTTIKYSTKPRLERTQCLEKGYLAEVEKYGLNPLVFEDCCKFFEIRFKEAVEKNKKLQEEREKDKVQLIQPGEAQYKEIQKNAKKALQSPTPEKAFELHARPKMTNDEAVAAVKNSRFGEQLRFGEKNGAKPVECTASWNTQEGYYQVVCIQEDFYYAIWNYYYFMYNFFTVDSGGKVEMVGDYVKKRENAEHKPDAWRDNVYFGKPMWGVK